PASLPDVLELLGGGEQRKLNEMELVPALLRVIVTEKDPNLARLPYEDRVKALVKMEAYKRGREPWILHLKAKFERGKFRPLTGEPHDDQVDRSRAETLHERRSRPKSHDGELHQGCLLCGMPIWAKPTANGIPHGKGPFGPCMSSMCRGWHYAAFDATGS
ncbi:hypothetical protein HK101_011643, partial [Irineochytrium annulatum]